MKEYKAFPTNSIETLEKGLFPEHMQLLYEMQKVLDVFYHTLTKFEDLMNKRVGPIKVEEVKQ